MKTIAARMLDRMQIEYELRAYEFSEEEMDAISVAQKIGMPPNAVPIVATSRPSAPLPVRRSAAR